MMDGQGVFFQPSRVLPIRSVPVAELAGLIQTARAQPFRLDQSELPGHGFRAFDPATLPQAGQVAEPAQPETFKDDAASGGNASEPPPLFAADPPAVFVPPATAAPVSARGFDEGWLEGHKTGLAEGLEAGRHAGRAELQEEFGRALDLLAAAHARLTAPTAADTAGMSRTILAAVRALAAERAGQMIDDAPLPFLARIEKMAERVSQGMNDVELRLNPKDLSVLAEHLAKVPQLSGANIVATEELARGDIDLRIPGVHVADLIAGGDQNP